MKIQKWFFFISTLHMMNLFFATCRPAPVSNTYPPVFLGKDQQGFLLHHKILSPEEGRESMMGAGADEEKREEKYKEVKKMIGSRPPSCANKCFGCMPCEAIQVPATSSSAGVQHSNYLPEGWKCKCGSVFYTP